MGIGFEISLESFPIRIPNSAKTAEVWCFRHLHCLGHSDQHNIQQKRRICQGEHGQVVEKERRLCSMIYLRFLLLTVLTGQIASDYLNLKYRYTQILIQLIYLNLNAINISEFETLKNEELKPEGPSELALEQVLHLQQDLGPAEEDQQPPKQQVERKKGRKLLLNQLRLKKA